MSEARLGDTVRVHYTGTLDGGDLNHPLAGESLTFELELVEIR